MTSFSIVVLMLSTWDPNITIGIEREGTGSVIGTLPLLLIWASIISLLVLQSLQSLDLYRQLPKSNYRSPTDIVLLETFP